MAIVIQKKETFIPVGIGELEFKFDLTDEAVNDFWENAEAISKELNKVSLEQDDEKQMKLAKQTLKKGFDLVLGEGAFNKIYSVSPSTIICMEYFERVFESLEKELNERGFTTNGEKKAKKYIQEKKNKK